MCYIGYAAAERQRVRLMDPHYIYHLFANHQRNHIKVKLANERRLNIKNFHKRKSFQGTFYGHPRRGGNPPPCDLGRLGSTLSAFVWARQDVIVMVH